MAPWTELFLSAALGVCYCNFSKQFVHVPKCQINHCDKSSPLTLILVTVWHHHQRHIQSIKLVVYRQAVEVVLPFNQNQERAPLQMLGNRFQGQELNHHLNHSKEMKYIPKPDSIIIWYKLIRNMMGSLPKMPPVCSYMHFSPRILYNFFFSQRTDWGTWRDYFGRIDSCRSISPQSPSTKIDIATETWFYGGSKSTVSEDKEHLQVEGIG